MPAKKRHIKLIKLQTYYYFHVWVDCNKTAEFTNQKKKEYHKVQGNKLIDS